MYYIGIDPGIQGAIAIVNSKGELVECKLFPSKKEVSDKGRNITRQDMPRLTALFKSLSQKYALNELLIMIEKPLLLPGQNVASTFYGGVSHGVLHAYLSIFFSLTEPIHISCKEWQEEMITDRTLVLSKIRREKRAQLKKDSIAEAKRLFPYFNFSKSKRSKVASDGMTDAALIAHYCWRTLRH